MEKILHNVTKLLIGICCLTVLSGWASMVTLAPVVELSVGSVQGVVRTHAPKVANTFTGDQGPVYRVYEYRGIPYALPPIGALRWALPVPVKSLGEQVFAAYNFGAACPQQARFNLTEASASEDCLSVNVSTPFGAKAGDNLPVLIWIHGGAFIGGSSALYRLDKLAAEGRMVVVSLNYRLGALGFMPNPAFELNNAGKVYNGNYGLEDQRLAMQWVRDHITAFGGNSSNITIAGESAGAGSVCMHLASPAQVKGLFHKAITQSAGCMAQLPTVAQAQYNGRDRKLWRASASIQEGLGCPIHADAAATLSCMRSKSVADILLQQGAYTDAHPADITSFSPLTGAPPGLVNSTVAYAFKYAADNKLLFSVPMIAGGTAQELGLYVGYYWQNGERGPGHPKIDKSTIDSYWLKVFYPGSAPNSQQSYAALISDSSHYKAGLHNTDPNIVARTLGQVLSDYNPAVGINNCLYLHTSNIFIEAARHTTQNPVYQFEFADQNAPVCKVGIAEPCPTFSMGAVHSSELNYLFPNLSNTAAIDAADLSVASQILANQMLAYWARFVATGNPNKEGLAPWPSYKGANTSSVLLLEPNAIRAVNSDSEHKCSAFWAPLYNMASPAQVK